MQVLKYSLLLKWANHGIFLFIFVVAFNTSENLSQSQQDSNLNLWNGENLRWPLDHHHHHGSKEMFYNN